MKRRWRALRARIIALYKAHGEPAKVETRRTRAGLWRVEVWVYAPQTWRGEARNADVVRRRRVDATREALRLIKTRWCRG